MQGKIFLSHAAVAAVAPAPTRGIPPFDTAGGRWTEGHSLGADPTIRSGCLRPPASPTRRFCGDWCTADRPGWSGFGCQSFGGCCAQKAHNALVPLPARRTGGNSGGTLNPPARRQEAMGSAAEMPLPESRNSPSIDATANGRIEGLFNAASAQGGRFSLTDGTAPAHQPFGGFCRRMRPRITVFRVPPSYVERAAESVAIAAVRHQSKFDDAAGRRERG